GLDRPAQRSSGSAPGDRQPPSVDAERAASGSRRPGGVEDSVELRRVDLGALRAPRGGRDGGDRASGRAPGERLSGAADPERGSDGSPAGSVDVEVVLGGAGARGL